MDFIPISQLLAPQLDGEFDKHMLDRLNEHVESQAAYPRFGCPSKIADEKDFPLAKMGTAWSTPAGLFCVDKTKTCSKFCYARSAHHVYKPVQTAFTRNAVWMHQQRLIGEIDTTAQILASHIFVPIFRIHEAGDFLDQFEVDVWVRVSELKPEVNFSVYTRANTTKARKKKLDLSALAARPNISLWISADRDNLRQARKVARSLGVQVAYGPWTEEDRQNQLMGTGKEIPDNSFICPTTNGHLPSTGACYKCKLCYIKKRVKKSVVFFKH